MRGSFSWRSWRGTKNFSIAPGLPISSRLLLFLHRLAIQVHTQGLAIQVHTQGLAIQVHTQEHAIQVHTQECTIQVHTQECAIQVHTQNVLSKCTVYSCTTRASLVLVHLSCTHLVHPTHAPLISFLNYRGTSRCLAVGTSTHVKSCTTPQSRAPLRSLVHHSTISCTTA